jgi:hypothetical protein
MCFSKSPSAPVNKPSYTVDQIDENIDVSHTDEDGKVTDIDGKDREEYLKATGIKNTVHNNLRM